ncbi:MAG: restriction endonuclease subunit S [Candidatus Omnitrophota bacterium]
METIKIKDVTNSVLDKAKNQKLPYVEIGDIDVFTKQYLVKDKPVVNGALLAKKNHVLISKVRPTRGAVTILNDNYCVSNAFVVLEARKIILPKYLFYSIAYNDRFYKYLGRLEKGTSYPSCRTSDILSYEIPIKPKPEQEKIISKLDYSDNLRQKRKEQLAILDDYLKSVFLDMFGDPRIVKKWEMIDFGDVISVLTDYHANGSYEILRNHVELKSTPDYALMVRTTDLENNNFTNDVKYITKDAYEFLEKSKVFGGEIIINKIGSAGNVYLMPYLNRPVSLGMNAFLLRFSDTVNNLFIYYLLTSDYGKSIISSKVKGAVTKTIRKDAIRALRIPLPSIGLQNKFASIVGQVEQTKQKMRASLDEMDNHFNALMQRYFG